MSGNPGGLCALLLCLLAPVAQPASALAQEAPSIEVDLTGMETGWHIVRPGENLIRITSTYLGSAERWKENWKLNPQLESPHILRPGTRLRVLLSFADAPPIARLKALSGQVEARPHPIPWNKALVEDLLVERDGLRTRRNSSSELEFPDGTSLVLSEESLIFLNPGTRPPSAPRRRSIEIVDGQAEVESKGTSRNRPAIEILVGTAKATAEQSEDGVSKARARKSESGGAQVMIYEGSSRVEAAGRVVAVERGMGTAVPKGAPPSPPEALLEAPAGLEPAAKSEWKQSDPWFTWSEIKGAASYTVEVCEDPGCGRLVLRAPALANPRFQPDSLPAGPFFWRVTAVSPSGLDGYPSTPLDFEILFSGKDTAPPTGEVTVSGNHVIRDSRPIYDRHATLDADMTDSQTGVDTVAFQVDGRQLGSGERSGPWTDGNHVAKAVAVDRVGNLGESPAVEFQIDAEGPAIDLRLGGKELVAEKLGGDAVLDKWDKRKRKWMKTHVRPRSTNSPVWTLLAFGSETSPIEASYDVKTLLTKRQRTHSSFAIDGNNPGALLFVAGGLRLGPSTVRVGRGDEVTLRNPHSGGGPGTENNSVVWIGAQDLGSGEVVRFSVRTEQRPSVEIRDGEEVRIDHTYLVIESEDRFGNERVVEWWIQPLDG